MIKRIYKKFEIKNVQGIKFPLNIFCKNYSNLYKSPNNSYSYMSLSKNSTSGVSPLNHPFESNKLIISNYFSFSNMENTIQIRTKEETLAFLKNSGIEVHHIEEHEKLETVQAGLDKFKSVQFSKGEFTFVKNLFLKSKAGHCYLVTVHPVRIF